MRKCNKKSRIKKSSGRKSALVWCSLGIVACCQIYLTILISSSGTEISKYEKEANVLLRENEKIRSKLIFATSLSYAEEKVKDLGFDKPRNIVYLSDQRAVAQLR